MNIEELKDFDNFFYYGNGDLMREIESDIHQVVNQNSRSLFYNRSNDTAGIDEYENVPNIISNTILIPFNIVNALSKRNTYVGNGQSRTKDRRVVVSQSSIKIETKVNELDISIFYIALSNINSTQKTIAKLTV